MNISSENLRVVPFQRYQQMFSPIGVQRKRKITAFSDLAHGLVVPNCVKYTRHHNTTHISPLTPTHTHHIHSTITNKYIVNSTRSTTLWCQVFAQMFVANNYIEG